MALEISNIDKRVLSQTAASGISPFTFFASPGFILVCNEYCCFLAQHDSGGIDIFELSTTVNITAAGSSCIDCEYRQRVMVSCRSSRR